MPVAHATAETRSFATSVPYGHVGTLDDDARDILHPESQLGQAIERIASARRGALILLADPRTIDDICSDGFALEENVTGPLIAELAKMDGAIILDKLGERILRANVHLNPDPTVPTTETGSRHRVAERTARQTGVHVIIVSGATGRATLFTGDKQHRLHIKPSE